MIRFLSLEAAADAAMASSWDARCAFQPPALRGGTPMDEKGPLARAALTVSDIAVSLRRPRRTDGTTFAQ